MDQERDGPLEELIGASPISPLIADLREAYQRVRAANERLHEWRMRREKDRSGRPGEPPGG